jgi:hypothetical protein
MKEKVMDKKMMRVEEEEEEGEERGGGGGIGECGLPKARTSLWSWRYSAGVPL